MKCFVFLFFIFVSIRLSAAGIGGMMMDNGCYNGKGFVANTICVEKSFNQTKGKFIIKLNAKAKYLESERVGDLVDVTTHIALKDIENYFNPDGMLPVLARAIVCKYHRTCIYETKSIPIVLTRVLGERKLEGRFSVNLRQDSGAEYLETVDKIEILLPGVGGMISIPISNSN